MYPSIPTARWQEPILRSTFATPATPTRWIHILYFTFKSIETQPTNEFLESLMTIRTWTAVTTMTMVVVIARYTWWSSSQTSSFCIRKWYIAISGFGWVPRTFCCETISSVGYGQYREILPWPVFPFHRTPSGVWDRVYIWQWNALLVFSQPLLIPCQPVHSVGSRNKLQPRYCYYGPLPYPTAHSLSATFVTSDMKIQTATALVLLSLATQAFTAAVFAPEGGSQPARRDAEAGAGEIGQWVSKACPNLPPSQHG